MLPLEPEPREVRALRRVESRLVVAEGVEPGPEHGRDMRDSERVAALALDLIGASPSEVFGAFLLDAKNHVLAWCEVSRGTLTASLVHPREVFGPALRLGNVAAIIVVHNHPSGDPEPSPEDLSVTRRLKEAGLLLGIPLLDHVVVAGPGRLGHGGQYRSLRERGNL